MSDTYDAANLARARAHDALTELERAARADEREACVKVLRTMRDAAEPGSERRNALGNALLAIISGAASASDPTEIHPDSERGV